MYIPAGMTKLECEQAQKTAKNRKQQRTQQYRKEHKIWLKIFDKYETAEERLSAWSNYKETGKY